jgi:hypothetical protein
LEEYPLLEEKFVGGVAPPNENPLIDELLEPGTVMHADIAIAPRLHKIMATIRTTRVMPLIIAPRQSFANRRQVPRQRAGLFELGWPLHSVLASTAREKEAMDWVQHLNRSPSWKALANALLLAACAGAAVGCFDKRPTQVLVTQVAPAIHPAKPPGCDMPVLTEEPTAGYQQIAIVEAWADVNEDPAKVVPELKRQACATGADALLIVSGKKQDIHRQLYGVTPNESETKVTSQNRTPNQSGDYINTMQYKPKLGEEGHTGYYVDALAIDYPPGANTAATGPSKP